MVIIKKIALLMFVFSFVFSNAQEKNLKEKYNNLKNNEEKIDFIFENIISKQINDFNTLENKKKDLENQISQLKENQKQSNFSLLKKDTTNKGLEITSLKEEILEKKLEIAKIETDINTYKTTISQLEKQIKEFEDEKQKEKEDLISFINFIIQQKSDILSEKILKSTLKNAKTHKLNTTLISELEEYININKLFISSKDLLNLPSNSKNIENKLNKLYNYNIQSSFPGLLEEGETIIYLLSDYQNKCNDLLTLFDYFNSLGVNESNIKESLNDESDEYKDYPYLLGVIDQKLENPNRNIPLYCD
tara:strand:- start:233 stop:1147 length:915 start_codon:yes stop_codon:yes gene_type:complete